MSFIHFNGENATAQVPGNGMTTDSVVAMRFGGATNQYLYIVFIDGGGSTAVIQQYSLGTSGTISGGITFVAEKEFATLLGNRCAHIDISSDGSYLFAVGLISNTMKRFPMSTAWDVTTLGSADSSKTFSMFSYSLNAFDFSPDGTKLIATGKYDISNQRAYIFPLSTAWSLSTIGTGALFPSESIPIYICALWLDSGKTILAGAEDSYIGIQVNTYGVSTGYTTDDFLLKGVMCPWSDREDYVSEVVAVNAAESKLIVMEDLHTFIITEYDFEVEHKKEFGDFSVIHSDLGFHSASLNIIAATGTSAGTDIESVYDDAVKEGDYAFIWARKDADAGGDFTASGFNRIATLGTSAGNNQRSGLFLKIATSSGFGSSTVATTDVDAIAVISFAVRGADPDDYTAVAARTTVIAADNSTTPTHSGVTTPADNCLIITAISSDGGAAIVTHTPPTGFTLVDEYGLEKGGSTAVAVKLQASQGASGDIVWGCSSSSAENHIVVTAIQLGEEELTHYSLTAVFGGVVTSAQVAKLAYSTSEDIRDENQLGINDVDYWDVGDALITDQNSEYLELEVP